MTDQPTQAHTEQEWLGHRRPAETDAPRTLTSVSQSPLTLRLTPAPLTPPTNLRPVPVIALSHPFEVAEATILMRKAITATAKLQQARDAAEHAESALSRAVATEKLAEIDVANAEAALLGFAREAAGK
ncbi:hypothetical protein [Arthrobacter sp. MP_2.3]|uniref:hypothetical protein n=1 Tax=Arthrobacter sp. MP_2.3 TaxID=3349633 RepID=UPI0038D3C136